MLLLKKEIKPNKGSAIIFPSNFLYPHQAKKGYRGNKMEHSSMVDVVSHHFFPTVIHEFNLDIDTLDKKTYGGIY